MKKIFLVSTIILCMSATLYAQPVRPEGLPKPACYTLAEIFNNIFSSQTYSISVNGIALTIDTVTAVIGGNINVTGSTVVVQDSRYINVVTSGSAGYVCNYAAVASSNIFLTSPAGYAVSAGFYSLGGDTTLTGNYFGGNMVILEGVPFAEHYDKPVYGASWRYTLSADTTLYYKIYELRPQ